MASIQKRGKESYLLTVEAGYDAKGKRIRRTKTVKCKGITEARKELAKFQVEVEVGEYIAPEKIKFGDFVSDWIAKRVEKELSPSTAASYQSYLKIHLLPVFSHYRLDQIKPIHLVNFLDDLSGTVSKKRKYR